MQQPRHVSARIFETVQRVLGTNLEFVFVKFTRIYPKGPRKAGFKPTGACYPTQTYFEQPGWHTGIQMED